MTSKEHLLSLFNLALQKATAEDIVDLQAHLEYLTQEHQEIPDPFPRDSGSTSELTTEAVQTLLKELASLTEVKYILWRRIEYLNIGIEKDQIEQAAKLLQKYNQENPENTLRIGFEIAKETSDGIEEYEALKKIELLENVSLLYSRKTQFKNSSPE